MYQLLLFLTISKLAGIIPGIIFYKKLNRALRLILLFISISLLSDHLGRIINIYFINNTWVINCYYLASYMMLIEAGKYFMENNYKKLFNYMTFLVTGFWLISVFLLGINVFLTWAFLIIDVIIITLYLYVLLTVVITAEKILKSPIFWSSLPIIVFFSCNIPIIGYFNYLADNDTRLLEKLFNIILILNYVCFPLFGISFYLQGRKQTLAKNAY